MNRKEKLKEIGQMNLDGYTSKFIIPVAHNFFKNKSSIFKKINGIGWKILNENENIQFGAYNVKQYIYKNMLPKLNTKTTASFINKFNNLVLTIEVDKTLVIDNLEVTLKNIDLWIFEEHVAFFVLNITNIANISVDSYTTLHNTLRNFKFINLDDSKSKIMITRNGYIETDSVLKYLCKLTEIKNVSFLKRPLTKDKNDDLDTIYNTSTNAKLLIGMQLSQTKFSDGIDIEEYDEDMNFDSLNQISILDEIPYYIASCLNMSLDEKSWIPNDGYIASSIKKSGFGIWNYSSGIALHDSCAFVGLKQDGGNIVDNVNNSFYFIYMLNQYINFQIRYIEKKIIHKDFEAKDINYMYRKLQTLKNQFISDEIGVKFQENEVHKIMVNALQTKEIIAEVNENLLETKNITTNNYEIFFTLLGFIFVFIFQDPLQKLAMQYTGILSTFILVTGTVCFYYRNKIRNYFKV